MEVSQWREVKLGNLAHIEHGWPFSSEAFTEFQPGLPIVVGIGNFRYTGGFRFESTAVKAYNGDYPARFLLQAGDILLVMTCQTAGGEILGIPGRIPDDGKAYLHNQRMGKVVLKCPNEIDDGFLYWVFLSRPFSQHLVSTASGTKILHTAPGRIEEYKFRLPPLSVQHAIAHVLGALDDKIELNRRMNETLEAMARALFKSWFVDFDPVRAKAEGRQPVGMDAETSALFPTCFDTVEIGAIPQGWRLGRLGDVAEVTMGQSPPGETYNELGEGLPFYQGTRDFGERFPSRRVYCTAPTRYANQGDIMLSVRAPVGRINVALDLCAIGRGVAGLRSLRGFDAFLLHLLIATAPGWEKFESEGTVFGAASKDDVNSFKVIIPSDDVMEVFDNLVAPLNAHAAANFQQGRTLASIRDTLLPKLLSGEIRTKDAGPIIEEVIA